MSAGDYCNRVLVFVCTQCNKIPEAVIFNAYLMALLTRCKTWCFSRENNDCFFCSFKLMFFQMFGIVVSSERTQCLCSIKHSVLLMHFVQLLKYLEMFLFQKPLKNCLSQKSIHFNKITNMKMFTIFTKQQIIFCQPPFVKL